VGTHRCAFASLKEVILWVKPPVQVIRGRVLGPLEQKVWTAEVWITSVAGVAEADGIIGLKVVHWAGDRPDLGGELQALGQPRGRVVVRFIPEYNV